jgi:Zn-dependent protease with chaperone function
VKFKGKDDARTLDTIPLGYELKVEGYRQPDGAILANKIEAKPNGSAMFEKEVYQATNQLEEAFREAGEFLQAAGGNKTVSLGKLYDSGPEVERVRGIVDRLLPPYLEPDGVRVYVIDNEEWNAMAMGNYSFYVFSGLLDSVDNDELAIILGHELGHATHEHTRRQHKRNMWIQMATVGAAAAISELDGAKRDVAAVVTGLSAMAFANGYSRDQEDQADRVGMRYAYEGGFDVSKGPRLWDRFAEKYGDQGALPNFFFGSHPRSSARAKNLQTEIVFNYSGGENDPR